MALLGVQLGLTMVIVSIVSKFGGRYSLARWILCSTGLIRYLHPSNDELRELAGVPKDITGKTKFKGKFNKDLKNPDVFHVPKTIDLQLESVKVTPIEVMNLRFYQEFHRVFDFVLYATVVYVLTEIYYAFFNPVAEMNLSILWCLIALGMCLSVMCSITAVYFSGDEVMGERSLCLVMGLLYLLIAMIVLIIDESNLEVGVDTAYKSFHTNAMQFMEKQGVEHVGPASQLIIKFSIAVVCAFTGALFTFPGIRVSKMFFDSLKYYNERPFLLTLIYVSYGLPLFLTMLWIRPMGRYFFTQAQIGSYGESLMSDETFESLRLVLIILMVLSRIVLMPSFLQSFLNVAQTKLYDQKKEAGRILNTDLQKQVAGIYYYLCIVALQYITPCLICLLTCFLYKTLGDHQWSGSYREAWLLFPRNDTVKPMKSTLEILLPGTNETIQPAAEQFSLALASLKMVFNETVFRGIFGFAMWWSLFLLVASSAVGTIYLTYLTRA